MKRDPAFISAGEAVLDMGEGTNMRKGDRFLRDIYHLALLLPSRFVLAGESVCGVIGRNFIGAALPPEIQPSSGQQISKRFDIERVKCRDLL